MQIIESTVRNVKRNLNLVTGDNIDFEQVV